MVLERRMGARVEDTEDPLHREATLSRLHSLVIRKDQENPSSMRDMGQKIMGKVVAEWEWWKPGSILR